MGIALTSRYSVQCIFILQMGRYSVPLLRHPRGYVLLGGFSPHADASAEYDDVRGWCQDAQALKFFVWILFLCSERCHFPSKSHLADSTTSPLHYRLHRPLRSSTSESRKSSHMAFRAFALRPAREHGLWPQPRTQPLQRPRCCHELPRNGQRQRRRVYAGCQVVGSRRGAE